MSSTQNNTYRILALLLLSLNIILFVHINTASIYWTNGEIVYHGLFWSLNSPEDIHFHTGLRMADLLKPFYDYYVDGIFRLRHVSYFFEMLSFKFWQQFGMVFFRNYTIIALHLLNTLLLGLLIFRMTANKHSAWIGALFLLNSGTALASLLYPFRNAKILVVTFFLLSWLLIASKERKLSQLNRFQLLGFFALLLLTLLTDEIAIFIIPIILAYIAIKDRPKELIHSRVIGGGILLVAVFVIFALSAFYITSVVTHQTPHMNAHFGLVKSLGFYWTNPATVSDTGNAFFNYFLRRNFGFWDKSLLGAAAGIAAALLMISIFVYRPKRPEIKIILAIGFVLMVKNFLLPHNSGYHHTIMPEGAVFPSLLFFSHYYVYCEAVLIALAAGLILNAAAISQKRFVLLLVFVTIIAISNATHLIRGPRDTLAYYGWDKPEAQQQVRNILAIDKKLADEKTRPLYLSFPAGHLPALGYQPFKSPSPFYGRIIPIRYLRSIEDGKTIVSYRNFRPKKPFEFRDELSNTKTFYDVVTRQTYDLQRIRGIKGQQVLVPGEFSEKTKNVKSLTAQTTNIDHIVFFVKGLSTFLFKLDDQETYHKQVYGQSYQMYYVDLKNQTFETPPHITIRFLASPSGGKIQLIGPFIF